MCLVHSIFISISPGIYFILFFISVSSGSAPVLLRFCSVPPNTFLFIYFYLASFLSTTVTNCANDVDDDGTLAPTLDPSRSFFSTSASTSHMEAETKRRKLTRNRLIRACTACRKLKTKCTYPDDSSAACERCRKLE